MDAYIVEPNPDGSCDAGLGRFDSIDSHWACMFYAGALTKGYSLVCSVCRCARLSNLNLRFCTLLSLISMQYNVLE